MQATHNGLRSIVAEMETQKWARLRVGIGVGDDGHGGSARDHVLTRFSALEERQLPEVLDAAADAVETWMTDGPARAAERFNAWKPVAAGAAARPQTDADPGCAASRPARRPMRPASCGPPPAGGGSWAAGHGGRIMTDATASIRGRRGRERRIDAQVAERLATRSPAGTPGLVVVIDCPTCRRSPGVSPRPSRSGTSRHASRVPTGSPVPARDATSRTARCPTAPRPTSRRRSRARPAVGWCGSRAMRRSPTGSPRSWSRGWATRRRS